MSGAFLIDGLTLKIVLKRFPSCRRTLVARVVTFFLWRKYCFTIFLLKFNSLNSTSLPRRK